MVTWQFRSKDDLALGQDQGIDFKAPRIIVLERFVNLNHRLAQSLPEFLGRRLPIKRDLLINASASFSPTL